MGKAEDLARMRRGGMPLAVVPMDTERAEVIAEQPVEQEGNITYKGKIYKDVLVSQAVVKLSVWRRVKLLFYPELHIEFTVFCKEAMPEREVEYKVAWYDWWELWGMRLKKKQGLDMLMGRGPKQ